MHIVQYPLMPICFIAHWFCCFSCTACLGNYFLSILTWTNVLGNGYSLLVAVKKIKVNILFTEARNDQLVTFISLPQSWQSIYPMYLNKSTSQYFLILEFRIEQGHTVVPCKSLLWHQGENSFLLFALWIL